MGKPCHDVRTHIVLVFSTGDVLGSFRGSDWRPEEYCKYKTKSGPSKDLVTDILFKPLCYRYTDLGQSWFLRLGMDGWWW